MKRRRRNAPLPIEVLTVLFIVQVTVFLLIQGLPSLYPEKRTPSKHQFVRLNITAHTLDLRREESGPRHYLRNRPLHAGDELEIAIDNGWQLGRYEWSYSVDRDPYLVFEDDTVILLDEHALLRWPES